MTQLKYLRLEERFSGHFQGRSSSLFWKEGVCDTSSSHCTEIQTHMAPVVVRNHSATLMDTTFRIMLNCGKQSAETKVMGLT